MFTSQFGPVRERARVILRGVKEGSKRGIIEVSVVDPDPKLLPGSVRIRQKSVRIRANPDPK
jgi:hypothetical protein